MKYYYETKTGNAGRSINAKDDASAMVWMRDNFGEHLENISIVYVEESKDHMRTVWIE
jgi:hypothetical protein